MGVLTLALCAVPTALARSTSDTTGVPAISYYTTVLLQDRQSHVTDIQGAFASSKNGTGPGGASVVALPCPHHGYLFTAKVSTLAGNTGRTFSAHIAIKNATLPPGIECNKPLPATIGTARFRMTIDERSVHRFTIEGERLPNGNLNGAVVHTTNTICNGRYQFHVELHTARGPLTLVYPFVLTDARAKPRPFKCH